MTEIWSSRGLIYHNRAGLPVKDAVLSRELNKAGELKLTLHPDHPRASFLQKRTDEIWVVRDGAEIFRGSFMESDTDLFGNLTVSAEGLLARLRDEYLRPHTVADYGGTAAGYLETCCRAYNAGRQGYSQFAVGVCRTLAIALFSDQYETIGESLDKLTGTYGGYLSVRRENGVNVIDYTEESGGYGLQRIEFGRNLTELTQKINAEEIYTRVIPLGKDLGDDKGRLTIREINGGKDWLNALTPDGYENTALLERYGVVSRTVEFNDIEDVGSLWNAGLREAKKCGGEDVSIELTARDLREYGVSAAALSLGDRYRIRIPHIGLDAVYPLTKSSEALVGDQVSVYTFGARRSSITARQTNAIRQVQSTVVQQGSAAATAAGAISNISTQVDEIANGDYVETATDSEGWSVRRWKSGKAELCAAGLGVSFGASGSGTVYGATGFKTADVTVPLPLTLADTAYAVSVAASGGSFFTVLGVKHTAKTSLTFTALAAADAWPVGTQYVDILITGRYKS